MNQADTTSTNHNPKVLVLCTRPDTATLWGYILREQGLHVIIETSHEKIIARVPVELPDVMVIDVDLENMYLIELCKSLRTTGLAPILLLLPAHHETLILDAYAAGVDDVVIKPISPTVFQAKIMAWARRSWTMPIAELNLVKAGRHRLDPIRRCLFDPKGTEIKLTNLEFNLLHMLMNRPGQVFTVDQLVQSIWGSYGSGDQILLKNVIYRLRKKIEVEPGRPAILLTWPKGYSFQE